MHLFFITLIGTAIFMISSGAEASSTLSKNTATNFNHLNRSTKATLQRGDMLPVAYLHQQIKGRLYNNMMKKRFGGKNRKDHGHHHKRDYATTLQYLKAAMNSYKKDFVTPPPVELIELEQQLPSAAAPQYVWPANLPVPEAVSPAAPVDLEVADPPLPDLQEPEIIDPTTIAPEEGNETTESTTIIPPGADIEDEDTFDPEEDPDDVDDPPVVNGVAVDREE
jgi:hypothetical protein